VLRTLSIRNLVLIDALEVTFGARLNVITGETGAGKSVVLECLGFVLGWQNRVTKLRPGAEQGEAVAIFAPESVPLIAGILLEAGVPVSDELIVRRTLTSDGRRQAYVNDRRVTVDMLRSLSEVLVELHGQQDDRGLMDERRHRELLDTFAALEDDAIETRPAWRTLQEKESQLTSAQAVKNDMMRESEYLSHSVEELTKLDPRPDEVTSLELRRRAIKMMERVRSAIEYAATCIGTEGIEAKALEALKALENAAEKPDAAKEDPLPGAIDRSLQGLNRMLDQLADVQSAVEECLNLVDADPDELQVIEDRLFAVRALARKHQVPPDELWRVAEEYRNKLAAFENAESHIIEMEKAVDVARQQYESAARCLSEARRTAASRLDRLMAGELAHLRLERAKFQTQVVNANPGPDGVDSVRFCVSTIAELAPGPIAKVASGGELSRLMLALKVCLSRRSNKMTMIFDEIDRGVGGFTAEAVATRLQRISETGQVIVVTHSAQVAARATLHLAVKRVDGIEGERMEVVNLNNSQRIEEISRMVAGEQVTDAVREAAKQLLSN
jgi:DNA repair protein RecN (Recombination protein N)